MREVCASAITSAGALGANNEHEVGHETKHATSGGTVGQKSKSRDAARYASPALGIPQRMSDHLQNDPDRAGGLISDAQGEFVAEEPGGAFDPRTFRADVDRGDEPETHAEPAVEKPGVDDQRMSGPGSEIDKAG